MNHKYLIFNDKGIIVKIERKDFKHVKEFYYRTNGGKDSTIKKAIIYRDNIHQSEFGHPVGNRFFHTKKKITKNTKSNDLPPGLSYGYSRGKKLYIVASWSPEKNNVQRKRFNIKKLGFDEAINKAIEFRSEKMLLLILESKS
jgi:hypothetical protein